MKKSIIKCCLSIAVILLAVMGNTFAHEKPMHDSKCKAVRQLVIEDLFLDFAKELQLKDADILKLHKIRSERNNSIAENKIKLENEMNLLGNGFTGYYPKSKDKTQNSTSNIDTYTQRIEKLRAAIFEAKVKSLTQAIEVAYANSKQSLPNVIMNRTGINNDVLNYCISESFDDH